MSVPALKPTDQVLTDVMGMDHAREYIDDDHKVHVYQMKGEGPGAELHVAVEPNVRRARLGAGGVHHVAFRTPNEAEYHAWTERLEAVRDPEQRRDRSLLFPESLLPRAGPHSLRDRD